MSENGILTARDYGVQINALIERRRYDHARALLAEALGQYPEDGGLLVASAHVAFVSGDVVLARDTLQELLSREPQHYQARSLLVAVYQDCDQLPDAEAMLIDLLRDYPEAGYQYARYAMLMYRTLHLDKAKLLAREALRLDPEDELALAACLIGDMIDGRRGAEQASLATLMRNHPESENTARMLITHLISRGRYRAAKRIAIELLKLYPHSREVLELVVQLEALSHWSMLPLWPFQRWGWGASIAFYVLTLVLLNSLSHESMAGARYVSYVLLGYCAYSWVYPSLLTRWLKRRAGL
ncbi:tetratricopeptide repeat protein [Duganella guangzhouensis]|jgi:tetratricopeptide (TPR) repeat protein|nr:tetratricopeptide repeat protein [Duganella guangzhouensis]